MIGQTNQCGLHTESICSVAAEFRINKLQGEIVNIYRPVYVRTVLQVLTIIIQDKSNIFLKRCCITEAYNVCNL